MNIVEQAIVQQYRLPMAGGEKSLKEMLCSSKNDQKKGRLWQCVSIVRADSQAHFENSSKTVMFLFFVNIDQKQKVCQKMTGAIRPLQSKSTLKKVMVNAENLWKRKSLHQSSLQVTSGRHQHQRNCHKLMCQKKRFRANK